MKKVHQLNQVEYNEFKSILEYLNSKDNEIVELGLGLLKNYPKNIQAKFKYYEQEYYVTLGSMINQYLMDRLYSYYYFYLHADKELKSFIESILRDNCYYEEI